MNATQWIITPQELQANRNAYTVVDVREAEEVAVGVIPGAKWIPLDEIITRGPAELNADDSLVLVCAHGVRSMHALLALRGLGFSKLRSLEGGIAHWEENGLPTAQL